MQGFIFTATTAAEKMNFISRLDVNFLDSTQNIDKVSGAWNKGQGHWVKVPAWRVCQGQLLCKGLILTATTAAKKWTLFLDLS